MNQSWTPAVVLNGFYNEKCYFFCMFYLVNLTWDDWLFKGGPEIGHFCSEIN